MDSTAASRIQLLRTAVSQAILAPSVHNTQPWRFVLSADAVEIYADRTRQLQVLDPSGRQLIISCGCALFNAEVSLAAHNYQPAIDRFPEPGRPDLLARITLPDPPLDYVPLAPLDAQIPHRQTNRRRFADETVPASVIHDLVAAAQHHHATLIHVVQPQDRDAVARLSKQADTAENTNPAYRAELRAWTSDDPQRRDGVPAMAVPHVTGHDHDDIPIRDFDTHGMGWLPTETRSSTEQCLLLLGTTADTPLDWLRAGEALQHLWLQATGLGYVASLFTQVIEIPETRDALSEELGLSVHPHLLLRLGRAPRTSASRRRRLDDVLFEDALPHYL